MAKKNTILAVLFLVLIWLWFPTGDFTDVFVLSLIAKIGMQTYVILSIIFGVIIYNTIDGKGIGGKIKSIQSEIRGVFQ
jgi:hypothetical protein